MFLLSLRRASIASLVLVVASGAPLACDDDDGTEDVVVNDLSVDQNATLDGLQDVGADTSEPDLADASSPDSDLGVDARDLIELDTGNTPDDVLHTLSGLADFARLQDAVGLVKYLVPIAGETPPASLTTCLFQDTARFPLHLDFLVTQPGLETLSSAEYIDLVLRETTRVWWGGAIQLWPGTPHPDGVHQGIASFTVYGDPGGQPLSTDQIAEAGARLTECAPGLASMLVFLPTSMTQQMHAMQNLAALEAAGVAVVFPFQLRAPISALGLAPGDAEGLLEMVPSGQIPDGASADAIVVADLAPAQSFSGRALISAVDLDPSHPALSAAIANGTPLGVSSTVYDNLFLAAADGEPVAMTVTSDAIQIALVGD